MTIAWLEDLMYRVSDLFLAPVLVLLVILFGYSLFASGVCVCQAWQRRRGKEELGLVLRERLHLARANQLLGYPLVVQACSNPSISKDELDVAALRELWLVRAVSRLAPMLGLVATMIPMGPALKSLANGNVQGISENLIVAFSAVIFGLVTASVTFWIASVKKNWLAAELVAITALREPSVEKKQAPSAATIQEPSAENIQEPSAENIQEPSAENTQKPARAPEQNLPEVATNETA